MVRVVVVTHLVLDLLDSILNVKLSSAFVCHALIDELQSKDVEHELVVVQRWLHDLKELGEDIHLEVVVLVPFD